MIFIIRIIPCKLIEKSEKFQFLNPVERTKKLFGIFFREHFTGNNLAISNLKFFILIESIGSPWLQRVIDSIPIIIELKSKNFEIRIGKRISRNPSDS